MADTTTQAPTSESPVVVQERDETVVGQPQAFQPEPHDGKTIVREIVVHTDRVVRDPNSPEAVQIPEGVGATTYGETSPLAKALKDGTAEEQFQAEAAANSKKKS